MGVSDDAALAAIVEATIDLAVVLDDEGTIVWRRRSERRWPDGLDDDEVVGLKVLDRVHPEDLPAVLDALARVRTTDATEGRITCRIFDVADRSIVHDAEVSGFDLTDVPGVEGLLVIASLRDSRRPPAGDVHNVDFSLAEVAPLGLAIVSPTGEVHYANDHFRARVGNDGTVPVRLDALPGLVELAAAAREVGFDERSVEHGSATLRLTARRLDGPGDHVVVSIVDITAEVEALAARVRSEQTFRATFDHTPAGIALVAPDGVFLEVNPSWSTITGYPPDDLVGRTFAEITHPDDLEADQQLVDEALRGERDTYRIEKRYHHRDGREIWVDLRVAAVRDDSHQVAHFVSQILDITAAKQAEANMQVRERELTHQATHDHLTGLPNRALLEEHLRVAVERTMTHGDQASVLLIDLDDFKPINDTHGHAVGDQVLVEVGGRLSTACRDADIVARLGGDEFVAVTEPRPRGGGRELAARLLTVLAEPLTSAPGQPRLTASIGIADVYRDDTVASLLARADTATYAAKADGGDTFAPARDED